MVNQKTDKWLTKQIVNQKFCLTILIIRFLVYINNKPKMDDWFLFYVIGYSPLMIGTDQPDSTSKKSVKSSSGASPDFGSKFSEKIR